MDEPIPITIEDRKLLVGLLSYLGMIVREAMK